MKTKLILSFLLFISCLQHAYATQTTASEIYLGSREGDPSSLVENVSIIYGDYTEVEVDLTVSAPDSLVLSRFYTSRNTLQENANFGGWRFNPQCSLTMQKDPKGKTYSSADGKFERTFVYAGNPDGSILTYVGWKNITNPSKPILFKIDPAGECLGMANTARGDVGAWTNLKNNELYYNPQNDSFELLLCTQGKRFYTKNPKNSSYVLTHEILPSGNKIFYEFNNKNQLELIKETNGSEKKVLAWIKICYEDSNVHLETSDGKTADYQFQQDSSGTQLLTKVTRSHKPTLHYQYRVTDQHILLTKKTFPEGRFIQIDYYNDKSNENKVRSITVPEESNKLSTVEYIYSPESTEVNGPGSRKVIYRFDDNLLVAIEQYLNGSIYKIQKKSWGKRSDAGNLITTSFCNSEGEILYHKYFIYDAKGNIIEEREYGDLNGTGAINLTVDEDGCVTNQDGHIKYYSYFSGKTADCAFQRNTKGSGIKYWYKKGTNLLIKKLVLTQGSLDSEEENYNSEIKQRFFYEYNDDAVLIKVVVDDGKANLSNDFYDVKVRMITQISPKEELPNAGVPEVIEQKYSTPNGKSEFLIKKTINHFDDQGNLITQDIYDATNAYHHSTNKQYAKGLLILEIDPMGNQMHYFYDANQNLIKESRSDTGLTVEYRYDLKNRLICTLEKSKTSSPLARHIAYDAGGYKSIERDHFDNETIYENDSLGRPIKITYSGASNSLPTSYAYSYDLFDNPVSITDPEGKTLKKKYNVKGSLADIHYPDGTKETFRYNSSGNLQEHCCRNGILEVFDYDYIGRSIRVAYYRKGSTSLDFCFSAISCGYSAFHKIYETDAKSIKTSYTYDGAGRVASINKGEQKIDFSYDALGRTQGVKKWKNEKEFSLQTKEYDLLDRIIEEKTEDSAGHTLLREKFIYNEAGYLTQIIGYPQNKECVLTYYEYDTFGRVVKVTNGAGNSTHSIYDDCHVNEWGKKGSKCTLIDSMGNATEGFFDSEYRLIQTLKKDSVGKVLSSIGATYDDIGNIKTEKGTLLSVEGRSGDFEIEYGYNQGSQLEAITFAKGTPKERSTRFEYNSYGELIKKFSPGAKEPIAYRYDTASNLEMISYKDNNRTMEHRLSYDYNKNLIGLVYDDLVVRYTYDENNLLTSEIIKDAFGAYQIAQTYDGEGKVTTIKLPDGSSVEYSYEGPLVKKISRFNKDQTELYNHVIAWRDQMGNMIEECLPGHLGSKTQTWDEAGRRLEIASELFQDKVLEYDVLDNIKKRETSFEENQLTSEYDYNALLQLIAETGIATHQYSYDSLGNRLQKNGVSYKFNELNELLESEDSTYTYHLNGNLATRVTRGKTWSYQSNPLNQITSIDFDQGKVTFIYDLTGKRLSKYVNCSAKKKILRFFYLGDTEIGSVDEKGNIVELKVPSNPNNPESPAIAIEIKKDIYIPIYDLQGNIACLLDHSRREIVESYRYSLYGEEEIINGKGRVISDTSLGNPWRFRGKRIDKEVNLIYFGYRYYDPEIGRWIMPDPMGTIDGLNLYTFVRNNPMKYVDHFGFNSELNENCGCAMHNHPGWHHAPPDCVCICGKNKDNSTFPSYRSTMGGDIKSALGGLTHGAVDFAMDSIHSLQTGATYMGAAELGINFYERIDIIKAVEQSQIQQANWIGTGFRGMIGIDESDSVYDSFRSTTTAGLEVASLVMGGYGVLKGGMTGLSKWARTPIQASKIPKSISTFLPNPLHGTNYGRKVILQMQNNPITGLPDFHGFPKIVENYAKFGRRELITGKDGLTRTKITLDGGYRRLDGHFEWIIEPDRSISHRFFVPNPKNRL